jgi:uncharacterized membrane protein
MSVSSKERKIHESIISSVIISIVFLIGAFVSLGLGSNAVAVFLLVFVFINLLRLLYLETKPFRQAKTRIQKPASAA